MIIARTYNVAGITDPDKPCEPLDFVVPLRETPFPGDIIRLADQRRIRVIRREFLELSTDPTVSNDAIDVELGVRLA